MPSSFQFKLFNGPFDDPGLFIPFTLEKRAIAFDLGETYSISPRDILKISHVFITHTHMDHFIGFDRLLRLFLGRDKILNLYGPEGFIKNIEGKLSAYSWNLVENFKNKLILNVTEIRDKYLFTKQYRCENKFLSEKEKISKPFTGLLIQRPAWSVYAVILDHGIPCLGFSIKERFHISIKKNILSDLGLKPGPWLKKFKEAVYNNLDKNAFFELECKENGVSTKIVFGDLLKKIALITPGQKVTYITDVIYSSSNIRKIIPFAKNSTHLFIESAFLEQDSNIARKKYHLTANQAGTIAYMANVKNISTFHFSPRYAGKEDLIIKEADSAKLGKTLGGEKSI